MIRVILMSDIHNYQKDVTVPDGDIVCICGDLTSQGRIYELIMFKNWYSSLPHQHKVVIAGNHDKGLDFNKEESIEALIGGTDIHYLEDSGVELAGLKFFGTPWTPKFGFGWGFNGDADKMSRVANKLPDGTHVWMCHGPPKGILDTTFISGEQVGCPSLLKAAEMKKPKVVAFGHIHEGYGSKDDGSPTLYLNVSICNFHYDPVNKPIWVDFNEDGEVDDYGTD